MVERRGARGCGTRGLFGKGPAVMIAFLRVV
jgi:hypothetical protein